jgi:hypothetical protein
MDAARGEQGTHKVLVGKKTILEHIGLTVYLGTLLSSVGYAIYARSLDSWLEYTPWIAGIQIVLLQIRLTAHWGMTETDPFAFWTLKKMVALWVLIPTAAIAMTVLLYSIGVSVKDLYLLITSPAYSRPTALVGIGLGTLVAGLILFYFRLSMRCIYGLTEAMTGITVAVHRVSSETIPAASLSSGLYLAILTAGVYLVVRGLDNIHIGLTKEPYDPVARRFLAFIEPSPTTKNPPD